MCQGCGVQRYKEERTVNDGNNDRCALRKEHLPASRRQVGRGREVSQEGDAESNLRISWRSMNLPSWSCRRVAARAGGREKWASSAMSSGCLRRNMSGLL